ncbi:BRCA1-associated ATM activator 1 [Holothuria leucospilota]|uniref:BRCA1-associated ATM activator 1 n=1 Tax=Holothuria leucospilota TaxID=206669 RepID=A0A9Q1C0W2_HOLLE|nr:BRCA1-associated ATM activator 1 [Holothuria leucospilota]
MTDIQEEDFVHTLELLPRVLTLIASTDHEIKDDTYLEKIMSWLQSSFRDKDKLCPLLSSSTFKFLSSVSSPDKDCSSSCLSFALKLLPSLVISITKHSQEKRMMEIPARTAASPAIGGVCEEGAGTIHTAPSISVPYQSHDSSISTNGSFRNAEIEAVDVQDGNIFHKDLVKIGTDLLKKSLKREFWEDVSIRNSWMLAVIDLTDQSAWIPILNEIGAFSKSMELLKDQSMFVVKAAQLFLAKIIHSSDVTKDRDDFYLKQSIHDTTDASNSQSKEGELNGQVSSKQTNQLHQTKDEEVVSSGVVKKDSDVKNSQFPLVKRKLNEATADSDEDRLSKVAKHSQQETVHSLKKAQYEHSEYKKDTSVILSKWKNDIMQLVLVSGETLSSGKYDQLATSLQTCQDHNTASSIGILSHLLGISSEVGVYLIAKNSLIQQYCSVLQQKDARPVLVEAVVKIFCLFLEQSTELLSLPEDTLWSQIDDIMSVAFQKLVETRKLKQFCQLLPALLGLCNKMDHVKCLPVGIKNEVKMLMSILMVSLKVSLEDVNQSGIKENQALPPKVISFFQSATKQDLYSVKYYSLVCLERIILEGSLHLAVGCTELLEALNALIGWILCQHLTFSKQKVDRFLKQYLDVLKALQEKDAEPNLFLPIMHSVMQLISSSDCDNTVLNKSLHLLKFHVLFGQTEGLLVDDQQLMKKAVDALQKHLLSLQWEARDSAINFIGTLLAISDGAITNWFIQTKLHHYIWDRLEDEESYVREASLNALGKLSQNQTLWKHFMEHYDIKEIDIIKKVTAILMKDPGGFARRAAINLLCSWLKEDNWVRSSLLLLPKWKSDETVATEESCVTIPAMVFCAVTAASRDLDWEVKLSSLEFWGEFLQAVVPEFILPDVAADMNKSKRNHSKDDNQKAETCLVGNFDNLKKVEQAVSNPGGERELLRCQRNIPQYASVFDDLEIAVNDCNTDIAGSRAEANSFERRQHMISTNAKDIAAPVSWIEILDEHICLRLLFEKLEDEDRTVCSRACEILLSLKAHLTRVSDGYDGTGIKCGESDEGSQLKHILYLIAKHKIDEVLNGCLEGSQEKMSSLLEEILSAANVSADKKINIDCY